MSERHKAAANRSATARAESLKSRISSALVEIEEEIAANGGVYPKNGGSLSLLELVRRAGISESTLYKKNNAELAIWTKNRLSTLAARNSEQLRAKREQATDRVSAWRERVSELESKYLVVNLQLQKARHEIEVLEADNRALKEAIDQASNISKPQHKPIPTQR